MSIKQLTAIHGSVYCKEMLLSTGHRLKQSGSRYYSVETAAVVKDQKTTEKAGVVEDQKTTEKTDQTAFLKNYVNPLRKPDYFEVNNLFSMKELFDARVHFGHREDTLHDKMRPYIFGSRLGHLIFDLPTTAEHLRRALNIAAHIAHRGGIILFATRYHQHCSLVEQTAIDCEEFAHTKHVRRGLFTNSHLLFQSTIRLPDLIIFLNTLDPTLKTQILVYEAAKMNIPTIGIVDSNSDPTIITYPVPGNDDSLSSIELYCRLFKTAILKGKEARKKEIQLYNESK